MERKIRQVGWHDCGRLDIPKLVDKVITTFMAVQNPYELREFLEIVRKRKPKTVVEIGTARGGLLYALAQVSHPDARIVSIDLPGAPNCGGQTENERRLFSTFGAVGQQFRFIPSNSLFHTTRERLREILAVDKIDLLFIDGDHSYGGVASDFRMYSGFAASDGIVALHDILLNPEYFGPGNEVEVFWRECVRSYTTTEIIDPDGARNTTEPPPGARYAYGIGLISF